MTYMFKYLKHLDMTKIKGRDSEERKENVECKVGDQDNELEERVIMMEEDMDKTKEMLEKIIERFDENLGVP